MQHYGNVKGRKYYTRQPLVDDQTKRVARGELKHCPNCRQYKPASYFAQAGKEFKFCAHCRRVRREYMRNKARNSAADGTNSKKSSKSRRD